MERYVKISSEGDVSDKIAEIEKMVAQGEYFTINRARPYGKTTTLRVLEKDIMFGSMDKG